MEQKNYFLDWLVRLFVLLTFGLGLAILIQTVGINTDETILFPLASHRIFSLWAITALYLLVFSTLQWCNVQFRKNHIISIVVTLSIILWYYSMSLYNRNYAYYWDNAVYYKNQIGIDSVFRYEGLINGFKTIFESFGWDYSYFINCFTGFIYNLNPVSENWYIFSFVLLTMPAITILIAALIIKIMTKMGIENSKGIFALSLSMSISVPLLHEAFILGQPDLFGLIFALIILLMLIDYHFESISPKAWFILFFSTIAIILTRRWYLYWVVSFWGAWAIYTISRSIKRKEIRTIVHIICFAVLSLILSVIVASPLIRHILEHSYSSEYAFYNEGGFLHEIWHQTELVGIFFTILYVVGFIAGLCKKQLRNLTIITAVAYLMAMWLFTRVQNMSYHQSLLLMPCYLYFGIIAISSISHIKRDNPKTVTLALAICLISINTIGSMLPSNSIRGFAKSKLYVEERDDVGQIRSVANWIKANCSDNEKAYFIPHFDKYNPDIFRNILLPDRSMWDIIPYGTAVPGTHSFSTELFSAKYVITTEPFTNYGISQKINDAFSQILQTGKFSEIMNVDMEDGYALKVYQRIVPADKAEIDIYRSYLSEECIAWPALYTTVFDEYEKQLDS